MTTNAKRLIPAGIVGLLIAFLLIGTIVDDPSFVNPLEGSSWTLVAFGSLNKLEPVDTDPERGIGPFEVSFKIEGGKWLQDERGFSASDGCLDAFGAYAVASDSTLLTGNQVVTLPDCSHVPEGGPPFLKSLENAVAFDFPTEDSLHIYTSGDDVLVMTRSTLSNKAEGAMLRPSSVRFTSSHPNPFSGSAMLRFTLDHPGPVSLVVYDMLGREVTVLFNDDLPAGEHSVAWNADGMPAGQYVARLAGTSGIDSQQLMLVR